MKKENAMEKIEGYVFIAKIEGAKYLFGKGVNTKESKKVKGDYETFLANSMTPYDNIEEAKQGAESFMYNRKILGVTLAEIKLEIAGDEEEAEKRFGRESGLIVIAEEEYGGEVNKRFEFIGQEVEGKRRAYPLRGAYLSDTDFRTFEGIRGRTAYHMALDAGKQMNRQGSRGARIAKFELKKIATVMKKASIKRK